jgi:positive regulator of sigma E activity
MKLKIFLPIIALGHLGGSFGLALIGNGFKLTDPIFIIFSLITFVAGFLFVKFYRKIYKNSK